ncbi:MULTISPECIES: anti-sigma factor [Myxococcus]|uniref:Zf-HC2 domain-containing protein n=1 Tax=Myxococcus llanfairpwllgwyngyllgogerychwyrndrobwllllantysiliogogogochensis TaxID=2590453 RepID=A0A540X2S7_9BACT|nr:MULTISPECIES: anti-sigma factor [Myxococcus]NTX07649.1 zf-HC2 domain-containing protein [Myxococcus sp. CA040A]NTX41372.1 zf-HC2 domain-containing protein [Myxococcus sp. CA033]TQF15526.1 zf-HC2 domain-containing protein [Myxococcus llanfairpwllgwyngyllgogerychwyrndrobwllllantysiliogogogochensis]
MSTCRESELDALLAGELAPEDAARVRAHAEGCAACKHALAWQRLERGWMAQRARREPARPALSFAALEARLAHEPQAPVRHARREGQWRHWGKMAMAAAAAVAFVGLSLPRGGTGVGGTTEEPWSRELIVATGVEACEDAAAALEARVGACLIASPMVALRGD